MACIHGQFGLHDSHTERMGGGETSWRLAMKLVME